MNYLGFDLETGGFDKKKHTITEAYFAIWDENWNFVEDLHMYLKNDAGEVIGEQEAFRATGIDPELLLTSPNTLTYTQGRIKLLSLLERHKIPKKRIHYRPLGQNIIAFDIPFMQEQGFLSETQLKKAGIHHNALDSTCIVTWLKDMGVLPSDVGNLGSLVDYFNLPKGTAHRAKDDVWMQMEVYRKLCDLFRKNVATGLGSSADNDLLKIVEL